ncbi:MAG: hypothetical protein IIZ60_02745 [Clostridia bacterium]|nr:hypothetical protein [Clostridia bacterium]
MIHLLKHRRSATILLALFLVILYIGFLFTVGHAPRKVSEKENRTLAQAPDFSVSSLMDGSYISGIESYYSDQFIGRDFFLDVNSKIKHWTSQFAAGDDGVVIVNSTKDEDDFAGQSLDEVNAAKET